MPKKRPKQPDLTPEVLRRLRDMNTPWYPVVDSRTGGFSIWSSVWENGRKTPLFLLRLPPRTPKEEIAHICEEIGCPPPWISKDRRPLWREGWRVRHEREQKPKEGRSGRATTNVADIENAADEQALRNAEDGYDPETDTYFDLSAAVPRPSVPRQPVPPRPVVSPAVPGRPALIGPRPTKTKFRVPLDAPRVGKALQREGDPNPDPATAAANAAAEQKE